MHNVTAPINPCAEPDCGCAKTSGSFRQNALPRLSGSFRQNPRLSSPAKAGDPVIARPSLLDAPPEPVIGPAKGRTRWRGMTGWLQVVRSRSARGAAGCRSSWFIETGSIVPETCARPLSGMCPHPRGAKRRQALVRNAAPGGLPYGKARPFSGREQPAHNADRRAYRRLTAAFFLRPRDRLLETDRGAHSNALDSTGFPPLSSAPPARCRTDPCSWAGRCLPRPPEARLARPNPQAPRPSPFACAS